FDPITQRDYYGLQAVFAGVDRANRPYDPDRNTHQKRRTLTSEKSSLMVEQTELRAAMAQLTSPELQQLDRKLATLNARLGPEAMSGAEQKSPSNGYHSNIEPTPAAPKWVQVDWHRSVALDEVRLIPARPVDFPDTPGFGFPPRF